jgi:hypothetical protein
VSQSPDTSTLSARWMRKLRLRAMAFLVGVGLAALAMISLTSIPAWPIVGVAVACVAVALNSMASRLDRPVCYSCGTNIANEPIGVHGRICRSCGSINEARDRIA